MNMTVQGTFATAGSRAKYQITVSKVSDVKIIQKGFETNIREVEKKWACGGKKPK